MPNPPPTQKKLDKKPPTSQPSLSQQLQQLQQELQLQQQEIHDDLVVIEDEEQADNRYHHIQDTEHEHEHDQHNNNNDGNNNTNTVNNKKNIIPKFFTNFLPLLLLIGLQLLWISHTYTQIQITTQIITNSTQFIKQLQTRHAQLDSVYNFTHMQLIDSGVSQQIQHLLADSIYDPHYFIKKLQEGYSTINYNQNCQHQRPIIYNLCTNKSQSYKTQLPKLQLTKSSEQYEDMLQQMLYKNKNKPYAFPNIKAVNRVSKQSRDLAYFYHLLDLEDQNLGYLQAEFYRYDRLYNIGHYGEEELPLCVSIIGRNNANTNIEKVYKNIHRQNYTNYHIVHIDDNSDDGTPEIIMQILNKHPQLKNRTTLIHQRRRRNQLYNRDYSIRKYCNDNEIVVDLDADDWLIGRQVFQLINALYQAGHRYQDQTHSLWAAYMSHIVYSQQCKCILPNIDGQIPQKQIKEHTYRIKGQWRTTQLRTFRKQIYLKIDTNQFIDHQSDQKQFYTQSSDAFIHAAIYQLSGPRHTRILDQFPYFYTIDQTRNLQRQTELDFFYSIYIQQTLTPYEYLSQLTDVPTKVQDYTVPLKQYIRREIKTWEIREKRSRYRQDMKKILDREYFKDSGYVVVGDLED